MDVIDKRKVADLVKRAVKVISIAVAVTMNEPNLARLLSTVF